MAPLRSNSSNNCDGSVSCLIRKTSQIAISNPWPLLLFLGIAILFDFTKSIIRDNSGQLRAIASQIAPDVFSNQYVFLPRTPYVAIGIIGFLLLLGWLFALCCTLTICLSNRSVDNSSNATRHSLRAAIRSSVSAYRYISVLVVLTVVGLLLFVVPGIYIAIRSFVGLPALVLDSYSTTGAIRESWRRTAGNEILLGLVLSVYTLGGYALSLIPVIGNWLAIVFVVPALLISSVLCYTRCV